MVISVQTAGKENTATVLVKHGILKATNLRRAHVRSARKEQVMADDSDDQVVPTQAVRIEPVVGIDQINDNHYLAFVMMNSGEEGAEDERRDLALYVRAETGEWLLTFLEGWNGYPQVIIAELAAAFARFTITT